MVRALQTCIHLFKNHPYKNSIKFVIVPLLREVLEGSSDIAKDIETVVEWYRNPEHTEGILFDFSLAMLSANPSVWQVTTLTSAEKQADLLSAVSSGKPVQLAILDKLKTNEPRYETHKDLFARAKQIKRFLREYLQANPLNQSE